ncbi:MAG: helix-turn-helix transcriptional regulator [Lachnospiraceae bacterium]|nr:helix-turn-helix transcriptional regulator [Lachnospiraceae bacterium]
MKLSKKAVAESIGVSVQTYSSYESGRSKPMHKRENYEKLAEVLGCDKDFLMEEVEAEEPVEVAVEEPAPVKEENEVKEAAKKPAKKASRKKKVSHENTPVNILLQYEDLEISYSSLVEKARQAVHGEANEIKLYVKPSEYKAYFVAGDEVGDFDL